MRLLIGDALWVREVPTSADKTCVWLAWKEFDGKQTIANVMMSNDDGATWTAPQVLARAASRSDHPLLANDGQRAYFWA